MKCSPSGFWSYPSRLFNLNKDEIGRRQTEEGRGIGAAAEAVSR